jgi:hypothetical protein
LPSTFASGSVPTVIAASAPEASSSAATQQRIAGKRGAFAPFLRLLFRPSEEIGLGGL